MTELTWNVFSVEDIQEGAIQLIETFKHSGLAETKKEELRDEGVKAVVMSNITLEWYNKLPDSGLKYFTLYELIKS